MRMKFLFCCSVGVMFCLIMGSQVWAQKTQETQTARRIYIEGARFLQQKRYEEASSQFRLAYKLLSKDNNPKVQGALRKLRYFLGLCYFKMKEYDNSKKFLNLFIQTTTTKSGKRYLLAQKMLVESKRKIALRPRRPPPRPRVVVRQPPPRPRVIVIEKPVMVQANRPWRAWPFVIMGVGVAVLGVGGVMGYLTSNAVQQRDTTHQNLLDAPETPFSTSVARLHKQAETFAMATNSLFIGGGVVTALGVILIFTSGRGPAKAPPPTNTKSLGKSTVMFPEVSQP